MFQILSQEPVVGQSYKVLSAVRNSDAEIKIPCAENPELSKVLFLTLTVGQNVALHASAAARNFVFLCLSTSFFVCVFGDSLEV